MKQHRSDGRGQALALFALVTPVILAFMALGLDAAHAFLERRDAQGAADLAALAGARFLHDDVTTADQVNARAAAVAVGVANGYQSGQVTATTPWDGDVDKIHVSIDSDVSTFFMPVLDIIVGGDHSSVDVDAHAIAYGGYTEGEGSGFAIFALESCPSLQKSVDISGSTSFYVGKVHSNSDVYISGSNLAITGPTTHSCGSGYPSFHDGGGGNTYAPAPTLGPLAPGPEPDPIAKVRSDFTCDYTAPSAGMWDLANNGSWWVGGTKASKTLRAGTYCSTGSSGGIKLSDSDIGIEAVHSGSGGVTFMAQTQVELSGSDFVLTPHEHGILIFSEGNSDVAVKVAASNGDWEGSIYAPNGTAEISGQNGWNYHGGIVAERVKLNGSNSNIDGSYGLGAPPEQQYALIE